jgi:hypothetical protein
VRVVVIASLEPEHLAYALRAVSVWHDPADVIVLNNASRPAVTAEIDQLVADAGMRRMRVHDLEDGSNTTHLIHEALIEIAREDPDDLIVKVDEDVILVTDPKRITPARREIWVPNVTLNNFTSKFYAERLWPDLYERIKDNEQPWHLAHPKTGEDHRLELLERFYGTDPEELASLCDAEPGIERIGRREWRRCRLVGGYRREKRGISIMAIALHGRDYLDVVGRKRGIDEVLLANAVFKRRMRYVVDRGQFCHHASYWSIRPQIQAMGDRVGAYNQRAIEVGRARLARA